MGLFDNKVALVTGAGSSIGRAAALCFAAEGARTIVVDTDTDAGEETAAMITQQGGETRFVRADVGRRDEVAALVDVAIETYGAVHLLNTNADIGGARAAHEETEVNWDRILREALKSVYLCCQAVIPVMLAQDERGSIVTTASVLGLVATPGQPAYAAAQGGVIMLTRQMAVDYATEGIRVNCVCPSDIEAHENDALLERYPINRLGTPEEVAEAVVWLASDKASFLTGVVLPVDGGFTVW